MGSSTFSGPIKAGTARDGATANSHPVVLTEKVTITYTAAAGTYDCDPIYIPTGSQIIDILVDVETAWNAGTSTTVSVGSASAGTQYAGSVDGKTAAGRIRPTFTGAQLTAMLSTAANTAATTANGGVSTSLVQVTVISAGTDASAGQITTTIVYAQR